MVLFKRKPVQFLPPPPIDDQDDDCWVIPQTGEVFTQYEFYLQRMDFYKHKRFICEITGHSGMNFFDALRSETAGSREINSAFPDALREPVLRSVQFSTTSRIDNLVDEVYDKFKNDFYPGEVVTTILDDSTRLNGVVRDKVKFPEIRAPDGTITRKAFARYFVKLTDRTSEEALVDDIHIVRDRKVFTKQMLRSFIKNTVTREAWTGAPWLVKSKIALEYRIDTTVPPHLQYGSKVAEKKEKRKSEQEGMFGVWQPHKLPQLKPAPRVRKQQYSSDELVAAQRAHYEEYQRALHADPAFAGQPWGQVLPNGDFVPYPPEYSQYVMSNGEFSPTLDLVPKQDPKPPPPPPIRYPIDDMDVEPLRDGTHRPALKFVAESQLPDDATDEGVVPGASEKTVGLLLETWNTLTVYCQVIQLESFTFDDFVDAIEFTSDEHDCQLFVEAHCALLKKLVNGENDLNGAIQISLPDLPDPEDEDDESSQTESRLPTPTPEPDVPARRTRSSLNKVQFADERDGDRRSDTAEERIHRASEMFGDYGWIPRLRKRDFHNGGWELIVVGLLHQLTGRPRLSDSCNKILAHLAPLDADATIETARLQYLTMDINLRAETMHIICQLFLETKTVKNFLEEMSNTMTQFRKVKIEHQRARKEALAKLKVLNDERRSLAPQEKSPTPIPELEDAMEVEKLEDADGSAVDSEDEELIISRSLRRGQDRAAERKRKRDAEQERRERAAEAKQNKGSKEYQKVLKAIDKERDKIDAHEEQIIIVDGDLREADCPRTRVLGKDRFCNRYWWFERNAMPHGGLPLSSTGQAGYMNGRLWVQGPDDMERIGFVDVPEQEKFNYSRRFGVSPAERKIKEEGPTNLHTAHQWGYYDEPDDVDMLLGWLDPRGIRELKLKKELSMQRELIMKHMEKRKEKLAPREESEEPANRMVTRTKTSAIDYSQGCLKWRNTMALDELGHLHMDPPPKPRGRGRKAVVLEEAITTRASANASAPVLSKQGKAVTRQGNRYHF